jgi:hypothetical protein
MSYIGNEPIVSATRTVTEVTATAGQTVFNANGGYTVGYLDVFLNGSQLQTVDFTATNGSSVTLTEAAQVNDVVRLVAWGTFSTSNLVSPNYTGTLTGGTDVVNIGSGQLYKDASGNVGIGTSSPATYGVITASQSNASSDTVFALRNSAGGVGGAVQGTRINFYGDGGYPASVPTGSIQVRSNDGGGNGHSSMRFYTHNGTTITERMRLDTSGNLQFNSGYGSVATAYGCRAWVNFNGTGTPAIRASGNVSSITDNGTGDYTVNFSTSLVDNNYSVAQMTWRDSGAGYSSWSTHGSASSAPQTTGFRINTGYGASNALDAPYIALAVFR